MDIKKIPNLEELDKIFAESEVVKLSEAVLKMKPAGDYFKTEFKIFDDAMMGGFQDGDLVVISGKTGAGKTTFAQNLTYNFAQQGLPCLWFSFECDLKHLWLKFQGMNVDNDFLCYVPLKTVSGKIDWMLYKIKEAILKYSVKIVFIDHLGFLLPAAKSDYDRNQESNYSLYLANICRQLKQLAIDNEIIIVLMAHVRKTDKELDTDDLAFSGGIAQESDFVFMIEREKEKNYDFKGNDVYRNEAKIKMVKNRRTGQNKIIKCQLNNNRFLEIYD